MDTHARSPRFAESALDQALADAPVILDEVQRAPAIFTAIQGAVDRVRRPGRFLLTGSANVLLVPRLADSLASRMAILRLHPPPRPAATS